MAFMRSLLQYVVWMTCESPLFSSISIWAGYRKWAQLQLKLKKKISLSKPIYTLSFKEGFGTGGSFDSYKCDLSSLEKDNILDTNGFAYSTTKHKPRVP